MHPIIIDLGVFDLPFLGETHLFLPTYGLLFAISVLLAWRWYARRTESLGLPSETLFNQTFYALVSGVLGAKLLLILVDWRFYLDHPGEILGTLRSAGVLVGGVVAGATAFFVYGKRHGLPLWKLVDTIVAPVALAQAIGRLGCLSAGCCWGSKTSIEGLAVVFTDPVAAQQTGVPLNVPLVPTQLLQFSNDLLLAIILTFAWRKQLKPDGTVWWLYVLLYSLGRGVIEFWRGDRHRGLYFGDLISTSQLFAGAGVVVALFFLIRNQRALSSRSAT